ncbi:MAG: DUF368 domain-containing protein [Bacilli bacterium]
MQFKRIFHGIAMGISDLIPGVSGSTIAVILGFYNDLLDNISLFFSKKWKQSLGFLIPLAIGVGITFIIGSKAIHYLLENWATPTQFFFLGLVLSVIPFLLKKTEAKTTFTSLHWTNVLIACLVVASLNWLPVLTHLKLDELTLTNAPILFFGGALGSMAMLLPGISGSFVLMVIGLYEGIITALSTLNLPILLVTGAGVAIGFIASSKIIQHVLRLYNKGTFAIIIGLVLGSIVVIWPGLPVGGLEITLSVFTFCSGLVIVNVLQRYQH